MKKFLQILSSIMLILNPTCGLMIVASIIHSCKTGTYWWIIAIAFSFVIVYFVLKFNAYMYRDENKKRYTEYLKWKAKFSLTHDLIQEYCTDYGGADYQLWRNKLTGKYIEI